VITAVERRALEEEERQYLRLPPGSRASLFSIEEASRLLRKAYRQRPEWDTARVEELLHGIDQALWELWNRILEKSRSQP
jgi:hypothetical protein